MAVEGYNPKSKDEQAWLEVDAGWVAGLWGLRATGVVRMEQGKILLGVTAQGATRGQVLVGELAHAVVPTRVRPKLPGDGEPAQAPGDS